MKRDSLLSFFSHQRPILYTLLSLIGLGLLWVITQFFVPVSFKYEAKVIHIPKNAYPIEIGRILDRHDLIRRADMFYLYTKLSQTGPRLKAGSFQLSASMSLSQISHALQTDNGAANLTRITITEGTNIHEIAHKIAQKLPIDPTEFIDFCHQNAKSHFESEFPFLADIPVTTIEGYLFPDTYYFRPQESIQNIVKIMLREFSRQIWPLWDKAPTYQGNPKSRFNFHQVLTIASLIEEEARVADERRTISSVFYNRLQRRQPLASDPTVVYALGKSYKDRVLYKDLKVDSPYNTYRYSGFPPSPISSPGSGSFKASLTPIKSDYFFFVAHRNGRHYFSKTYKEHLAIQRQN